MTSKNIGFLWESLANSIAATIPLTLYMSEIEYTHVDHFFEHENVELGMN